MKLTIVCKNTDTATDRVLGYGVLIDGITKIYQIEQIKVMIRTSKATFETKDGSEVFISPTGVLKAKGKKEVDLDSIKSLAKCPVK